MAAIDQYIERIPNTELQEQIREEVARLTKKKRFGLVYENHLPDNVLMPEVTIRRGTKVTLRGNTPNDVYEVQDIEKDNAVCRNLASLEDKTFLLDDLVAVAQRGDVIYPYLKPMDSVENAPDSDLWHTLIEADNYHALQTLTYLYPGMVDCIYIDPPYNKPDSHDWKYNCDYVDGTDAYRHSKWLSMMEARLKIAKKLLNPNDSVLIVTIDELEYHHLGCLLEQMFPEARIQMVSSVINPAGVSIKDGFSRTNEFLYFVKLGDSAPSPLILGKDWRGNIKGGYKDKLRWNGLQNLEKYILCNYQMRVFDNIVQMKEIEIYYKNEGVGYIDTTMHGRERQKNNFNNLYLHGAGIDICLSDSEDFYLSILIRGGCVVGKDNCKAYKHGPILLYDAVIPKKANVDNQPPILEPLETPYIEDVFYAVRYGVRKMTENHGVQVRQEDKDLLLRAYLGDVKDIPCTELPGKLSFVKL